MTQTHEMRQVINGFIGVFDDAASDGVTSAEELSDDVYGDDTIPELLRRAESLVESTFTAEAD